MKDDKMELQLLPTPHTRATLSRVPSWSSNSIRFQSNDMRCPSDVAGPSLDLQLSNSFQPAESETVGHTGSTEAPKWQADQIQSASTTEKAHIERIREMTQREMELAQAELLYARNMWERTQKEVERVEKLKAKATRYIDSTCKEITCQACRQIFRP
ncbi:protein indeterminate-domain 16 [Lactuca sativa]|uniref:protein indeterminate-domain 16 n=1 Tax=Lactuca sativa TaxID=4236 RepID=UPI000CB792FA|nr:protein indeterminate-domain 16 [Lactuca sativa]